MKIKNQWRKWKNQRIKQLKVCPNCTSILPAYRYIVEVTSWMDYGNWCYCIHRWHWLTNNMGNSEVWNNILAGKHWHTDLRHECYLPTCQGWQ